MIRIYIDQQRTYNRQKPFRLRVMENGVEATAMYMETREEAERSKKFLHKVLKDLS